MWLCLSNEENEVGFASAVVKGALRKLHIPQQSPINEDLTREEEGLGVDLGKSSGPELGLEVVNRGQAYVSYAWPASDKNWASEPRPTVKSYLCSSSLHLDPFLPQLKVVFHHYLPES